MTFSAQEIKSALKHLRACDPVLKKCIKEIGPFTVKPKRDRYGVLVRSIVSQQISTSAARTITARIVESLQPDSITPESMSKHDVASLRELGVSKQKASYMLDLTEKVLTGTVDLSNLGQRSDDDVIEELIQVKGIGVWTAQMFLIFSLGRLDVLPVDDLGIRNSIKQLYGLEELPGKQELEKIAEPWRPYASVASWYCWEIYD